MKVVELMSQPAVCCSAESPLSVAAQLMWDHDCGALPVVDGDGRVLGMVTDRDVCMAAWSQGRPLHEIPVQTAMSKQVVSGHVEDALEAARQAMRDGKVRRLPIVDDEGHPLGLLSLNDLARHAARTRAAEREVAQTLASIGEPRFSQPLAQPAAEVRPSASLVVGA